jgi:hypothetical protein
MLNRKLLLLLALSLILVGFLAGCQTTDDPAVDDPDPVVEDDQMIDEDPEFDEVIEADPPITEDPLLDEAVDEDLDGLTDFEGDPTEEENGETVTP